jgi:hypothetical protein
MSGADDDDPTAIGTYCWADARFGYALCWQCSPADGCREACPALAWVVPPLYATVALLLLLFGGFCVGTRIFMRYARCVAMPSGTALALRVFRW